MIIDTGILYALADRDDRHHETAAGLFGFDDLRIVPEAVVVETDWLILERLGVEAEMSFLSSLDESSLIVESATRSDRKRAAELVATYRDAAIGYVDGVTVAIAERLGESTVATVDRRHFEMIRPRHIEAFEILPEGTER